MGCNIVQHDDYSIVLSQQKMLDQLDEQLLLDAVDNKSDDPASARQVTIYRHVIGRMLYLGRMSAPLMLLYASLAATKLSDLRTHHVRALASRLKCLKVQPAELYFRSPPTSHHAPTPFILDIITDSAMANKGDSKGREGYIIFRRLGDIFHPIQWSARRFCLIAVNFY